MEMLWGSLLHGRQVHWMVGRAGFATVNPPAAEDGPVDADPGVDHQESKGLRILTLVCI